MAASYPSSIKTFVAKNTGDTIAASHVNDLQDEVAAIETGLKNGLSHAILPDTTATYGNGSTTKLWTGVYANLAYISHGTDPKADLIYSGTGGKDFRLAPDGSGNLKFMRYDQTGVTLEGTPLLLTEAYSAIADGSAAAPSLVLQNSTTTGFYRAGANQIGISIAGAKKGEWRATYLDYAGTDGNVRLQNATSNLVECHIRPGSGKSGFLTLTEDGVSDRWALGVDAGDAALYLRQPTSAGTTCMVVAHTGAISSATQPRAIVYKTGNQTITSSTNSWTSLTFDAETADVGTMHDTVTNNDRITAPAYGGGFYLLIGVVAWSGVAGGTRSLRLRKGGATDLYFSDVTAPASGTNVIIQNVTGVATLNAGDYVTLDVKQDSGSSVDAVSGATYTQFMAVKLW